jgi:hypothetical protein
VSREFYGAKGGAIDAVNQLLALPASGREQDWEFELADPSKIDAMLQALSTGTFDFETKSALALLLISSMEEASELGLLHEKQVAGACEALAADSGLKDRMKFYWVDLGRSDNPDLVRTVLSLQAV